MANILYPGLTAREAVDTGGNIPCVAVTDCTSLYDTIVKERISLTDRRLSLEAAILRQSLDAVSIKWVRSEQMLADCLTKTLPGAYTREVLVTNRWTFGPDGRAPSMRARTLMDPTRVKSNAEAQKLNDAMTALM